MRILFLCHRVPFPPNRGDRIATHRRLLHLVTRGEVTCLTFASNASDFESVRTLESMGITMHVAPFNERLRKLAALPWLVTKAPLTNRCFVSSKLMQVAAAEASRGLDLIVAYSSCMAQFVESIDAPRVMEFGDLDSEKWRQYAARTSGPMKLVYDREARTLLQYETKIAKLFDTSLVVSSAEATTFLDRTGVEPRIAGNGVDLQKFSPGDPARRVPGLIVFTGVMNYLPNVEGCVRFATKILPLIQKQVPGARFRIVGAEPSAEISHLQNDSVQVTGAVPETVPHLQEATVAVAPLRLGRGLQNKVLEAMACGTPVVASGNACAGVDATPDEHFLLADSDEETAAAVLRLLQDPGLARTIGAAGRIRMEERYPWSQALSEYDAALQAARDKFSQRNATNSRGGTLRDP